MNYKTRLLHLPLRSRHNPSRSTGLLQTQSHQHTPEELSHGCCVNQLRRWGGRCRLHVQYITSDAGKTQTGQTQGPRGNRQPISIVVICHPTPNGGCLHWRWSPVRYDPPAPNPNSKNWQLQIEIPLAQKSIADFCYRNDKSRSGLKMDSQANHRWLDNRSYKRLKSDGTNNAAGPRLDVIPDCRLPGSCLDPCAVFALGGHKTLAGHGSQSVRVRIGDTFKAFGCFHYWAGASGKRFHWANLQHAVLQTGNSLGPSGDTNHVSLIFANYWMFPFYLKTA